MIKICIGYDPREHEACRVAQASLARNARGLFDLKWLDADCLRLKGLYTRAIEHRDHGTIWDFVSNAPMSTTHACARFLLPWLYPQNGWVLFTDGDIIFRGDVGRLFELADPKYAVMCVKHNQDGADGIKKGGHVQTRYARKNWSSVLLWNLDHPAHKALSIEYVNETPGRHLHAFSWLKDDEIGELPAQWNYLVGASPKMENPEIVHFTLGLPSVPGYVNTEYAEEWRKYQGDLCR